MPDRTHAERGATADAVALALEQWDADSGLAWRFLGRLDLCALGFELRILLRREDAFCGLHEVLQALLRAASLLAIRLSRVEFRLLLRRKIHLGEGFRAIHFAIGRFAGTAGIAGKSRAGREKRGGNQGKGYFYHAHAIARLRLNSTVYRETAIAQSLRENSFRIVLNRLAVPDDDLFEVPL